MKRILAAGLVLLLLTVGGGGLMLRDAEARDIDCSASNLSQYDALICYFDGQIGRSRLDDILPAPPAPRATGVPSGAGSTLISNAGQADGTLHTISHDRGQRFTTGSRGAVITSVSLEFENTATTPPTYELWIREFSGVNSTGPKLATFSLSSGGLATGVNTFTPTGSSPLILQPNTTYGVVFDVMSQGSNSGNDFKIRHTASDAEDGGGASGWTIDDQSSNRAWNTGPTFGTYSESLEITITGHSYDPPPPPLGQFEGTLKQLSEAGQNVAQSTYTCGGKPNPRLEAFYKDPLGTNWNHDEMLYCDLSTGEWVTGRRPQPGVDYARDDQLIAPGATGYNPACYFTDANGNRTPLAIGVKNADGSWARNPDGSRIFIVIEGGHWDPIAERCIRRSR